MMKTVNNTSVDSSSYWFGLTLGFIYATCAFAFMYLIFGPTTPQCPNPITIEFRGTDVACTAKSMQDAVNGEVECLS